MTEYRVVAYDIDSDDRLVRAVHADDLCAAVHELREEMHNVCRRSTDSCRVAEAQKWVWRLNELLEEHNAQAAMDHYR